MLYMIMDVLLLFCVFNYFTRPAYLPGLEVESKFVALLDLHTCPVSLLLNSLYGIIGFGIKLKFGIVNTAIMLMSITLMSYNYIRIHYLAPNLVQQLGTN